MQHFLIKIMSDPKYNFGSPSKMKGLQAGEKATLRFLDLPETIDTEWGVKYTVSILLLSHPGYPSLSSNGMKMQVANQALTGYGKTCTIIRGTTKKGHLKDLTRT